MPITLSYSGTSPATVATLTSSPAMGGLVCRQDWASPRVKAAAGEDSFCYDKGVIEYFRALDCRRLTDTEIAAVLTLIDTVDGISNPFNLTEGDGTKWKARILNAGEFRSSQVRHNRWSAPLRLHLMKPADYVAAEIKWIVNPDLIRGLWVFDQTGAVSTITDRSGSSHTVTLRDGSLAAINASTCTPGTTGILPYLTFNATHIWDTPDHNDFTATSGNKLSVLALADLTSFDNRFIQKGAAGQYEWGLWLLSGKAYAFAMNAAGDAYVGRYYNADISGDAGAPHSYGFTYSGGTTAAALKVYRDGARIDDTDSNAGAFAGMANGTATVATGETGVSAPPTGKQYAVLISAEEWTAAQILAIHNILDLCI